MIVSSKWIRWNLDGSDILAPPSSRQDTDSDEANTRSSSESRIHSGMEDQGVDGNALHVLCLFPHPFPKWRQSAEWRKAQSFSLSFCGKRRTLASILVGIDLYYRNMVGLVWIRSDGLASST